MEYSSASDNDLSNLSLNESIDKSDSESTHSTPEDERIKRLFFTCDTNGDGFITYEDIRQVCLQLDIEYCIDDIMEQLGTDANGRISYSDFVKRRSELLDDIKPIESDVSEDCESTISESKEPLLDESSQTSSFERYSNQSSSVADGQAFGRKTNRSENYLQNSKSICSQQEVNTNETESSLSITDSLLRHKRHDSWEFDSGTHDLEIDTTSLYKQMEASGIEMPENINEVLDLANKCYIDSINCIKREKSEINIQFKSILKEHDFLQKQIMSLKEEKMSIIRDLEKKKIRERMEYEDKITELQSIIGELSHNLNYYQFLTIKEEDDENYIVDNETPLKNALEINSNKCKTECNLNANENLKLGLHSKGRQKQRENDLNDLIVSEVVDDKAVSDVEDSHDSHATALEIDRLECKIINLETEIDLSSLHLNQSKENAERLTVLLGKYDSNNTALQLALNYADKAIEVYDLFTALLESEIGLVLANCRAAGLGKTAQMSETEEREEVMRIYELANQKRKSVEELAIDYLNKNFSEFDGNSKSGFNREHENYLKDILVKLNEEKSVIKNSITKLEPFIVDSDKDMKSMADSHALSANIENIVLKQDFISIKEMNADLRSQIYSLKKENSNLVQQVMKWKQIYAKQDGIDSLAIDLNEENISTDNEFSEILINELKQKNGALYEELENIKKKYSNKIKKLEQKITSMSQRNKAQVKILQNKICLMENEGSVRKSIETTL